MKLSNDNEKGLENFNFQKIYLYSTLLILVLLIGCASTSEQTPEETVPQITSPEETPVETTSEPEVSAEEELSQIIKIPNDIKEILEKGKTKLKSYSYNYISPEINEPYKIYVKGNKIKIKQPDIINVEGRKFYNTIYLDTEKKTAEAYCTDYDCGTNIGKIKDLDYDDVYIETPLGWLEKVTEANLIDERQVESRDSIYLETNIGKIIVESYYGFLYKIEDDQKKWEFIDAAFNSVKDSDVNPS